MRQIARVSHAATLAALLASVPSMAATYYVSPNGSDGANGSETAPFASVGKAQTAAAAGDTIYIRGGTYAFAGSGTVGVAFTKSGTSNASIKYFAYPGEVPVFDLTNLTPSGRVTGLDVRCSYIHLRGLEVKGVHQYQSGQDSWGVRIQGSNNILEQLNVHHNDAPGIFITSGGNNLVLNCDSHHNYDVLESGGSGDGFGCHSSTGGNIMRGCRAYDNSDDGFDFINATGSCLVEQSMAFRNGWVPGTSTAAGNGAGFKAGGYGSPPTVTSGTATHTVQQCVAFSNRSQGFYANHHNGRINFYNNTAYNNAANYNMLADSGYPSDHVIRNNIAFGSGGTISNLTGGSATYNSWNLSVAVSATDFASVDTTTALTARNADGSLPAILLLHLVAGSDLIDKGTNVGLAFSGGAPDLGAYEYGAAGGTPGAGGTSATGGAVASGGAASGGTNPTGGNGAGIGGASNSGETRAMGGVSGTVGGASAATGGLSSGGAKATGGSPSGGSVAMAGGAVGTSGGAFPAGGSGQGGATPNGGAPASNGGSAYGGTVSSGGTIDSSTKGGTGVAAGGVGAAVGGATATSTDDAAEPGGCSCRVPTNSSPPHRPMGLVLLGALCAGMMRRRRT